MTIIQEEYLKEYLTVFQINHKVGGWKLTKPTVIALKQFLIGLSHQLLEKFQTDVDVRIFGTADNIPINKIKNSKRNCPYKGDDIGWVEFYTQNGKKKRIYIGNGVELTNEMIAVLRAFEAAKVVEEVIHQNPELYAITLDTKGVRKAIIGIRIKDALRDKYNELNNLEKTVFNIREFLTPK